MSTCEVEARELELVDALLRLRCAFCTSALRCGKLTEQDRCSKVLLALLGFRGSESLSNSALILVGGWLNIRSL